MDVAKEGGAKPVVRTDAPVQVDPSFLLVDQGLTTLTISMMAAGAVLVLTVLVVAVVLYKKVRKGKAVPDSNFTPTIVTTGGRDFGSKGNMLFNKKTHSDIPSILSFIPTDVYVEPSSPKDFFLEPGLKSISSSHTTFTGKENPFSCQFSDFVTSEGGEVLSPSSDVSVIVPRNAVPVGRIQQVFVNITDDVTKVFKFEGQECATPLVECLVPGLKVLAEAVIVRLPLNRDYKNLRVYWSHSLNPCDASWLTVPAEASHIEQLMSYTVEAGYLNIKTYHLESFSCYASAL